MTEDFNDKFHDTTANAAESLENRVRRLKIRKLLIRHAILVATVAVVVFVVKKSTEDFESSIEEILEK
jgi:hypothetical protein